VTLALSDPGIADQLALLLRATLLMATAWAAATALRKAGASAAKRHLAWLLAIAALLALPVLWWLVPALHLPILPAEAAPAASTAAMAASAVPTGPIAPVVALDGGWSSLFLAVYAVGAAILMLRLVVGRRMLKRLWSEAGTARDPAWVQLMFQLSHQMGLSRRVELRISRGPAVPMTWGTLAPKVLLPAEASEWPPERRRLVLLHELAHVARRDSLSRSLASLACALYWFHPGAWFAARRMRMEQEHAADDRVLIAGGSAKAYARSLLHLARGIGPGQRFDQAAAMAGMYQLERRLVSITSPAHRNRPGTFFLSSSALLAGLTTLFVAAGVPVSASTASRGSFPAKRPDLNSAPEQGGESRGSENPAPEVGSAESGSVAPAGSENSVEHTESDAAPEAGLSEPVSTAGAIVERRRRAGIATGEDRPAESTAEGSRDDVQPLRDYGWELPRGGSNGRIASRAASSQPGRVILPAPVYSASNDRNGRLKWPRNVPRLVLGATPARSPLPASDAPLMLSWSLEVGGK
jgi:beta-lactamase regulating signal transducer with metallopeptidase domain